MTIQNADEDDGVGGERDYNTHNTSHRITSHHITSRHVASHHIISHSQQPMTCAAYVSLPAVIFATTYGCLSGMYVSPCFNGMIRDIESTSSFNASHAAGEASNNHAVVASTLSLCRDIARVNVGMERCGNMGCNCGVMGCDGM